MQEFKDVFARSYQDMPGLDPDIVQQITSEAWMSSNQAEIKKNETWNDINDKRRSWKTI